MAINPVAQIVLILYFVVVLLVLYGGAVLGYLVGTIISSLAVSFFLNAYFSCCVWSFWEVARDNAGVPFDELQGLITVLGENGQPKGGLLSGSFDYRAKPGEVEVGGVN